MSTNGTLACESSFTGNSSVAAHGIAVAALCAKTIGVEVVIFRGNNRNRRRGFHNLWILRRRIERERDVKARQAEACR